MGQFLQVNGDYNIKAGEGARITLDTGPATSGGSVRVTGNLVVEGETVTVSSIDLEIEDNLIFLNRGETGAGVTEEYSGILVDRGSLTSAAFIFNENIDAWQIAFGSGTAYDFNSSRLKLKEIITDSSVDFGDLLLIGTGNGVIKVRSNPLDDGSQYQSNVTGPNDIPNKKYVDDAIQNQPTFQIVSDNSRVIVTDRNRAGSYEYYDDLNVGDIFDANAAISVIVDGVQVGQFYQNRLEIGILEIGGGDTRAEISTVQSITNQNIFIRTQGTGKLETNVGLQLAHTGGTLSEVPGFGILHADDAGIGGTGLYFVNDTYDVVHADGELISKNKALLFSMIF